MIFVNLSLALLIKILHIKKTCKSHTECFELKYSYTKGPTPEQFDDFLFNWAEVVWPKALSEIIGWFKLSEFLRDTS